MLENRCVQRALNCRSTESLGLGDESRHTRRQIFVVKTWRRKTFDQQSVTTQYQNRIDSRTLTKCAREIPDIRHVVKKCEARNRSQ